MISYVRRTGGRATIQRRDDFPAGGRFVIRLNLKEEDRSFGHIVASGRFAPQITRTVAAFSLSVYLHSRLSLREFEAARIRIAAINGCNICKNWRSARDVPIYLAKAGVCGESALASRGRMPDEAFYDAVADWRDSPLFSERERLAIEYADRFARDHLSLDADEGFWRRLHGGFSDAEIVDLTLCIGSWITTGRFAHVLGLDDICKLPSTPDEHLLRPAFPHGDFIEMLTSPSC